MRDHVFIRHRTSKSLVECSGMGDKKGRLRRTRREGMWAFVLIPRDDADEPCEIHYWHRVDKDPLEVAMMLGHELGHIGDGGPRDELGYNGEERRADEFGYAARGTLAILMLTGIVSASAQRRAGRRGPDRVARGRRATSFARRGRSLRR